MTIATIERAETTDLPAILALLEQHHLPSDGLTDCIATTLVARQADTVVGSAALETYADGVLLRSVAVVPRLHYEGLGRQLMEAALRLASDLHAPAVYLLTTTAEEYFPKFGFQRITRADVPQSVQRSVEFTTACPSSAVVMQRVLSLAISA